MLTQSTALAADGAACQLVTLSNRAGMSIMLMDWGAYWLSARVPMRDGSLREALSGCARIEDWLHQTVFLGASVGRYANRIAYSRCMADGRVMYLQASEGEHQLHGGLVGFDKRRWQILQHDKTSVIFGLTSPDGDQGFAGELVAQAQFTLTDDNRVEIEYRAQVTQPCPVNLCNHAYFNLDGHQTDVRQHHLQLLAQQFLPVDESGIPCGDLQPVQYTGFDFRQGKKIADDFMHDEAQHRVKGYDHGFLLDNAGDISQPAARLTASDQRLQMVVYTTAPALQFYSGNYLQGTPARDGGIYQDWQGLALEAGFLADSPNHPHWPQPDCIVRQGQQYRSETHYQFIAG